MIGDLMATLKDKEQKKIRKNQIVAWYKNYKRQLMCIECDETHPACLEFHHRNPEDKVFEITNAVHDGLSKETILNEISKCDVLCANCHRKLHNDLETYFKVSRA